MIDSEEDGVIEGVILDACITVTGGTNGVKDGVDGEDEIDVIGLKPIDVCDLESGACGGTVKACGIDGVIGVGW